MLSLSRFKRPLIGISVIAAAFVVLFVCSRLTTPVTLAQSDEKIRSTRTAAPTSPSAVFNADAGSLGAIPDGTALSPLPSYGASRDVTFTVTGLSGAPSNVEVSFTSGGPSHTFRGDIEAVLKAPGGTPSFTLFSRTGATSSSSFGSSSDLTGPYVFKDSSANGPLWWTLTATPTTPGDFRTITPGSSAVTPAVTTMTTAFNSVTNPNGTWTLSFRDGASADTGAISAASLTLTATAPIQHVVDFNGDGKTDSTVVRNTGGGSGGQVTWFISTDGSTLTNANAFGISTDVFVPADYDGDGKTDVAVWRSGAPGVAAYYIFQSLTNTVRIDQFGQTSDNATVVADYTGDGKADPAVYRPGATAGDPSYWYYRASSGAFSGQIVYEQWGQNGDFVAPGDFDGDGKADFAVQRNAGGGQAIFWQRLNGSNTISNFVFGTPTDVVVPGDYDGDGKTDITVIRGSAGGIVWWSRYSTSPAAPTFLGAFGLSATDFPVQGDYDGDGKTDVAVWRPNADPGQTFFYVSGTTSGFKQFEWGQNGDYPVANYNAH